MQKGAIHVNAGGTGRAFCQTVLDLDRLVDLRVCVLEAAAYLAQTPSANGHKNQVQPTLGQETEGSTGNAFEISKNTEIAASPDVVEGGRPWGKSAVVADEPSAATQQPQQKRIGSMTKNPAYSGTRRLSLILTSVLATGLLAGCATRTGADSSVEAPYCYKTSKGRAIACTRVPAPSLNADAQAKRFTPDPNAFTVYVVRRNWGDGGHFVKISADNAMAAETLPNTMVRFKLKPGTHTFTLDFEGERQVATVDGKAGDLRFLRIDGTVWAWKSTFVWATDGEDAIRNRAYKARLVSDLTVR